VEDHQQQELQDCQQGEEDHQQWEQLEQEQVNQKQVAI
jgi:hypothetical protein